VGGIATHTIFGQAWADGVTVSVYPGAAQPSGWDAQPMGLPVTSAVVANGSVTFTDLSERNRYVAYAGGTSRRFLVPERRVDSLRGRVEDLEQGAEDTQLSADSYVATYPVLNAHAAISQAVLDAATDGKTLKISGVRHLNGTIAITQPVTIDAKGATIYQDNYGLAVFEVRNITGVDITGGTYVNAQTKAVVSGPSHDIYPAREYAAVVYGFNAHRVHVDGITVQSFVVGVKFGGDDLTYCMDNRVTNMTCDHLDFGVLVDKQDGLIVDGIQSRNIEMTQGTTPPHTVYTSGTSTRRCKNVTIKNVTTVNCVSSGVKTKFVDGLTMSGIINDGCERGFDIEDCSGSATNIVVRNITENTIADPNQTGIDVLNCHDFTLADSVIELGNADIPGVFLRSADPGPYNTDCTVQNVTVATNYDGNQAGDTRHPFWMQGCFRPRFIDCTHVAAGSDDKYMFGLNDGALSWTTPTTQPNVDVMIESPKLSGSQKLCMIRANQVRPRLLLNRELLLNGVASGTGTINDSGGVDTRVVWLDQTPPALSSISGLLGYFDARQAPVTPGSAIATMTGGKGTASQATGTLQPLLSTGQFALGTMPGVKFDGVDDRLQTDIAMPTGALTVAFVARFTDFAVNRKLSQTRSATTGLSIIATASTRLIRLLKGAATLATGTTALTADTPALVVVTVDTTAGTYAFRVNGVAGASGSLPGGTTLDAGSLDLGDATMLGSIGAYAVWSRVLGTAEIEKVEARMMLDWGL
jgi:hypothetical protein